MKQHEAVDEVGEGRDRYAVKEQLVRVKRTGQRLLQDLGAAKDLDDALNAGAPSAARSLALIAMASSAPSVA